MDEDTPHIDMRPITVALTEIDWNTETDGAYCHDEQRLVTLKHTDDKRFTATWPDGEIKTFFCEKNKVVGLYPDGSVEFIDETGRSHRFTLVLILTSRPK